MYTKHISLLLNIYVKKHQPEIQRARGLGPEIGVDCRLLTLKFEAAMKFPAAAAPPNFPVVH